MKKTLLFLLLMLVFSCDDNDEPSTPYVMEKPPVGKTFVGSAMNITFETEDTVSFSDAVSIDSLGYTFVSGKQRYSWKNGVVIMHDPYMRELSSEEITQGYFSYFEGVFTDSLQMEASFFYIGVHKRYSASGTGSFSIKQYYPENENMPYLWDKNGVFSAYLFDYGELTIHLWNGDPVAYIATDKSGNPVYRFDGRFLGWFEDGILYDKEGYAIGAQNGTNKGEITIIDAKTDRIIGVPSVTHPKSTPEAEPTRPALHNQWSKILLEDFLRL